MRSTAVGALSGLAGLGVVLASCATGPPDGDPLLVAAASDLRPAFEELGEQFTRNTGTPVTFDFGSSGQLAQQLIEGAPMDLYASADAGYVDRVVDAGVADPGTRAVYAHGRLVIWSPDERRGGWGDLAAVARDDEVASLAIANPAHAPYGRAARQALVSAGVWDELDERVVHGQHVADALRLAASGNADVAIVAWPLALAAGGRWALVDEALHDPLRQELVVVADEPGRGRLARRFAELVTGDGREVLRRHGLLLPGESHEPATGTVD